MYIFDHGSQSKLKMATFDHSNCLEIQKFTCSNTFSVLCGNTVYMIDTVLNSLKGTNLLVIIKKNTYLISWKR